MDPRIADQTALDPISGCLVWLGRTDRDGYPVVYIDGKSRLVHRKNWEDEVGPIPPKHVLDHLIAGRPIKPGPCRHRCCIEVTHLEPVSIAENSRRVRSWQAAKTHCPQGHAYAEHGVRRVCGDGATRRFCRACGK